MAVVNIDEATRRLNTSADKLDVANKFLTDVVSGAENATIPNPNGSEASPSLEGMVKKHTTSILESDPKILQDSNAGYLQDQVTGLKTYPADTKQTASVAAPNNNCPAGTTALRDATGGVIYRTSKAVSGVITDIDFSAKTATVGGVSVRLSINVSVYHSASVADMIAGTTINGSVDLYAGQLWMVNNQAYRCDKAAPAGISDFSEVSAKERQQSLMGILYGKIQKDDATQTITIACRGDSLTYGEDTTVDPRPANQTPTPSGRVHNKTRASTPYPDALQTYLQPLFSNVVSVINQGYSGDNTKTGYGDWGVDVNSDLTIIMYGTNDAAHGFSPYQSVEDYIKYYRLIILRELFERNAPVMLITPPPQKQVLSNNRLLDGYRMAVYQLGLEFGAPVIDGIEVFKNVDSTLFSDNVHFRAIGYQWLASAVQARILSKPANFTSVSGGSNMTVRFPEDGVIAKWTNWNVQTAKASQVTPPLTSFSGGYVVETSSYFEKICFSFYCEQDDIIAMPNIEIENATVSVQLNNGIWQPQYTFDDRVQSTGDLRAKPDALYEYSALNRTAFINRNAAYEVSKSNRLHIATRGWKTLTLYIKSNGSTGSSRLTVGGVNFESYETVEMWDRHFYGVFGQQKPLGNVTPRYVGQFYTDTTPATASNPTTQVVWLATGLTSANWKVISNIDISQSLLPTGNVTPYALGQMYLDTTSGQFKWYKASGLAASNWVQISNN